MANDKKCFIIMPITTPKEMVDGYSGGARHFDHVYECLFKPSVEAADYVAISPKATGSVNIQASIIKNLETADLVLCDMSCLNANVFFEWGIRTSLNKPVCIVKDELTETIPFDPGTLNIHPYNSHLAGWEIENERTRLVAHIRATAEKSGEGNELWRYFGIRQAAQSFTPGEGRVDQLAYIAMQMETLQRKVDSITTDRRQSDETAYVKYFGGNMTAREAAAIEAVKNVSRKMGKKVDEAGLLSDNRIGLFYRGQEDPVFEGRVAKRMKDEYGVGVSFTAHSTGSGVQKGKS